MAIITGAEMRIVLNPLLALNAADFLCSRLIRLVRPGGSAGPPRRMVGAHPSPLHRARHSSCRYKISAPTTK